MPTQPEKIGKYEVLEVIGRGGMGIVYKANDPQIGRFVAIKMITSGFAGNPDLLKRFYLEARSTGNLQNPNIVTIYDLGDQDGNPYLVMEYLEGTSLESVITSRRPLTLVEKLGVILDVCNGLGYAHQRGLVHRDIKPANIMLLNDGVAKIVDFGIARMGDSRMTRTDQVIGSIHYMSPEQLHNQTLDARTDIFATGVVLFQLLTRALPFEGNETAATLLKIINDPPPPLSAYIQDYPPELEGIVVKALAKDREQRYGSAKDLAFDLLRVQEQLKQDAVAQYLRRAEQSVQRAEWGKAKDELQKVLRIDRQHTQAHRLLREVQDRAEKQNRGEQARQLKTQADEAIIGRRFDEALRVLEQAISLDTTNIELQTMRESVVATRARAAKLQKALQRAEAAQGEGDLDHANEALKEALTLEPNDTQANALKMVLARQLQEHTRKAEMQRLLGDARDKLTARKLTEAFEILKRAEVVDPASAELQSLLKLAVSVRDQEARRGDLEKLSVEIQELLGRDDYGAAIAKAGQGLQRHPNDSGLLRLKALAETQQQRVQQKIFIQKQHDNANSLLESCKLGEALSLVEKTLQSVPNDAGLLSLRSIITERINKQQSDEQRTRLLQRAREALSAKRYDEAIRILEAEAGKSSSEARELLEKARAENIKERAVTEAVAFAQQLLEKKELDRAAEFLESTLRNIPDQRLRDLQTDVHRRKEQFNRGVQSSVSEAQRILKEHGAADASKFLEAQPRQYFAATQFREFAARLQKLQVAEAVDHDLAKIASLDAQVRMLEEALRKHSPNEELEQRLAAVQEKKRLVRSIVEQAQVLEENRQYQEALQEWDRLREAYPQYPELEREISRITQLEEQRRNLANKPAPSGLTDVDFLEVSQEDVDVTVEDKLPVTPGGQRTERFPQPPARLGKKLIWLAGVAALLVLAGVLIYLRPSPVSVSIQTDPSGSEVSIDGKTCRAPCELRLKPGTYRLDATLPGYQPLDQSISVASNGEPQPVFKLIPNEAPSPSKFESAQTGKLFIKTETPGVEVFADRVLKGSTDQQGTLTIPLAKGQHEIQVRKGGYRQAPPQRVEIQNNGESLIAFKLELLEAVPSPPGGKAMFLSINTSPGAQISIDQRSYGVASNGNLTVQINPGNHNVALTLEGYKPHSEVVSGQPGQHITKNWELEKLASISPRPSATISANLTTIQQGQSATLAWATQNANDVSIDGIGPVSQTGNRKVAPTDSTTYHLVAKGPGGTGDATFTISVTQLPKQSDLDRKGIQDALDRYKDAYESESVNDIKKAWPSVSKDQQKGLHDLFNTFSAIRLTMTCERQQLLSPDEAQVACKQGARYTLKGRVQPESIAGVDIRLKKQGDGWVIDSVTGR